MDGPVSGDGGGAAREGDGADRVDRGGTELNRFARDLFSGIPDRYDILAEVLSLGQNRRWRRAMVDHVVAAGPVRVLDVATGTAGVARQLARRTGGATVVGIDLTAAMLRRGQQRLTSDGPATSAVLALGRAEQLPFPDGCFDALTFTYLMRYVDDPARTVRELVRVVQPGAPVASLDFFVPPRRFWRFWWWLYTRLVLPAGGRLAGRPWLRVGRFLGPNISGHYRRYPLERTMQDWRDAGLVDVHARPMSLGGGLVMWGRKGDG